MTEPELIKLLADHMTADEIAACPEDPKSSAQERLDRLIAEARLLLAQK